jgi:hypothetical protein
MRSLYDSQRSPTSTPTMSVNIPSVSTVPSAKTFLHPQIRFPMFRIRCLAILLRDKWSFLRPFRLVVSNRFLSHRRQGQLDWTLQRSLARTRELLRKARATTSVSAVVGLLAVEHWYETERSQRLCLLGLTTAAGRHRVRRPRRTNVG